MTAPRAREQADPPSPPDRRPPRRGGGSSPSPYTYASAAGRAAGPARLCGARRGLARSARAVAVAALLALAGALALPATAQADVLVSNIGQTDDGGASLDDGGSLGQAFSVGAGGGDYTLTSIEIPIEDNGIAAADIDSLSVSVWSTNSSGLPSSLLHSLTNPASITADTTATFNAQAGATLEAGKTYAVVVYYDKTLISGWPAWVLAGTGDDDSPATGWEIADSSLWRGATATNWSSFADEAYKIRVNGSAAGGGTPTCTLNTGDLWCGVVTVAAISSGGSVAAHGFAGTDGGLDDKTFSVGTNNYTIDGLYVGTAGDLNLDLTGALDAADKGNLELVVGSTAFDLDDATHVSAVNGYLWTGTGLDWSSDTHVTLRMRRAVALSTDATLSGLTVYDGSSNLTLSPSFASGTETYTASAAYDIATVTVTANKNQADATIAWLDASDMTLVDADAMAPGRQVALAAGANTFKVKVTAEDGTTTKTYTVTVNRASPSCTLNTGDLWCGVVTVGNGTGFDGYVAVQSLGDLSDTTFSVGTNNYTIVAIYAEVGGFNPGRLTFNLMSGLTSADRAALVLHLGSTEFEFSDATVAGGLSYKWHDANLDWSSESFVTLRLRDTPVANNAPVFSPTSTTRTVAENSAAGTSVGAVIPEATDSDSGDTLTYSMEGTDAASFAFDASTRQITTITGVTYNHEATKNSYSVTVKASDGTASATIAVTIDVTDVNEKSAKPDKPVLAMVTGSSTSLTATWTKPDLNGGPDIAGYDVAYREGTTGLWEDFSYVTSGLTTTITGLTADTSYQARVRTTNDELLSDWSDASDAVKTNAAAVAPTISAVAVTSTPVLETDTYGAGETIEVSVTFDEAVNATSDTDFVLSVAGAKRAPLVRGSGTATLVFGYTVVPGDEDDNGIWIGDQDRTLVGNRDGDPQNGTITSVATSTAADLTHAELGQQSGHKVDGSRSIVSVAVSSTPMLQTDTYGAGETIRFTVTFNVAVDVSGDPVLTFALGNQGQVRDVDAAHEGGGGSTALVFAYTVVSTDEDNNGIFLRDEDDFNNPDGPVRLDSDDTIRFAGTSTDVPLYWQGRGTQSGHKVDGSRTTGNTAPSFTSSATFDAAENQTAVGTVVAADSDADDNITGYAITGGADQALFEIGATTGELTFDNAPNFEDPEDSGTDNTYVVTVEATSGMGTREMTATQTITVTVTDADEKSAKPDKPTLAAVTGSSTTLTATWAEPDLDGGPAIAGYDLQYKVNTATTWEDFAHSGTAVTTTVTGLTADTSYQVQVRAKNGETDSDWSDPSDAVKTNAEMSTPTCTLNTGDLWCGVVTVGLHTVGGFQVGYGYADASVSTNTSDTGVLSDRTFSVGTNNYTIDQVVVGSGANAGAFLLRLNSALTAADLAALVLHVDGGSASFAFSDAIGPILNPTYQWNGTGLDWSSETSVTLRLREANNAPVFSPTTATREVAENSAVGTSVGAVVTATDADNDTLTYSLEGTDAASFEIDSGTGQIKTKSGVTYNFEAAQNTYEMTVKADDGNGGTDTIEVNIVLLDADEKSAKPDKPMLAKVTGSSTSLTATWTKPGLDGGPDITGYAVEYREGTTGTWTAFAHTGSGLTTTITGLTADTSYQVQVRAKNGETDSDWSDPSDAVRTNAVDIPIPPGLEVTLHLSDEDGSVLENAGWVTVTATASPASPVPFTVTVSADPVAPATEDDFRLSSNRVLSFAANATESTGTVRIQPVDDDDPEPPDVVTVSGAVSNAAIPDPDNVTLTIINDDPDLPQDIAIDAPAAVDEDAGTAAVTVTLTTRRNTAPVIGVNLFYRPRPETATRGNDYTLPFNHLTRFAIVPVSAFSPNAAGTAYVAQHAFTLGIVDDQEAEVAETIVFQIYSQNNNTGSPEQTITIRDDDAAVPGRPAGLTALPKGQTRIQLAWTAPADEGSFPITHYRIEASEDAGSSWNVVARTRDARTDFRHGGLSAGDTRHYRVSAISAAGASGPSDVASATTVSAGPAATNPDLPPPADVTAVPKLPRQILLSWWRDPNAESKDLIDRFHYRYRVRDANTWSDWATAGQTLIPNTTEVRNYNERIVTGLTAGTTYEFQVRSVDKDDTYSAAAAALATAVGPRTISIARPSGPVTEGEPLRFTLSREQPHGRLDVVVRISETGDMLQRSRPNSHYVHKTVRFAGGQTTAALVVETVDDGDAAEPNSRVTAEVKQVNAHPYGYLYEVHGSRGSATKTVTARTESTRSAALSVADAEATEGEDATLDFVVRLDGNPGSDVTVDYRTVDGTATAGSDYTETSGTLTFAPGEDAKTVPVPIADDDVEDNGETFTLVLSNASGATIADAEAVGTIRNSETTTPQADLTASFEGVPEAHDGESGFRFRVAFSEDIGISYRSLREDAFTVTGGRVTGGKRVDGRRDLFEMTVEPDAGGDVTITLPAGRECGVSGAICTKGENRRQLTNSPSATVAGPPEDVREPNTAAAGAPTIGGTPRVGEELTASTSGISDADGLDNASFAYQWIRTDTDIGGAAGSTYTAVDADEGKTLKVRVSFTDGAGNEESLTSAATDAIAARPDDTPEPDTLTTGSTTEPVKVSVADARVREAPGATLDFAVTLSGAAPGPVTVDYRTADANAKAGEDYTKREGRLTFDPGERRKTVRVTVLDDAHDEGDEKMVLVLYRASGAIRDDYLAVGTIKNTDPMPKAWLARFGRAASDHAVAAIEGRWRGGAEARPQTHLTIGGRRVENLFDFGRVRDGFNGPATGPAAADPRLDPESAWGRMDRLKAEAPGPAGGNPAGGNPGLLGGSLAGGPLAGSPPSAPRSGAARSMLLNTLGLPDPQGLGDLRQLLMGSSFFYSRPLDEHGEAGGSRGWLGNWSAWGETAATRFSGADGPLALNGEVATATLGADSRWGRWHGGVALAYSEGDGVYTHPQATGGAVRSTLTSLHPFARYEVSERTSVWGVLGYGVGGLTLTPDSAGSGSEPGVGSGSPGIETGLKTAMAAFGGRGVLSVRSSRFGAFEFAVVSDALVTNTVSDTVENLMGTAGQTSRVRVLLEGSGSIPLGNGGRLMPTLEAGLRYDDGDAETGSGLEVGAGLGYAAGALAVEVTGRMLLAHQDSDYEEWGFSGSIRYQPRPGGRGLSMNLGSTWGQAQSGVQSLWSRQDASGLVRGAAMHAAQRFQAELGYGFAGRRADSMWMPFLGAETAGGGAQSLRLGVRLTSGPNVEMGLEFGRRDNGRDSGLANGLAGPEHAVHLRGSFRW